MINTENRDTLNSGYTSSNTIDYVEDDQTQGLMQVTKRSWIDRTFGQMQQGSLRSSNIALISCTLGSGILTFPSNARSSGVLISGLLLLLGAFISRMCMSMLMHACFKTDSKTYPEQIEVTLGMFWRRIYEADVILYVFGVVTCMQIMFTKFLWEALISFGVSEDYEDTVKLVSSLSFIVLNFPVSLQRNLYSLRYVSQMAILVLFYINIAMTVYFFMNLDINKISQNIVFFQVDLQFFASFATTIYGYICHQLLFPLKTELKNSTLKRMSKICNRSVAVTFILYFICMYIGYFTWLNDSEDIIIDNYDNMFFTVGKALLSLSLYFAVAININPMRLTLLSSMGMSDSKKAYFISTLIIQVTSGLLGYMYPQVKSGFGFLGGFLGTNIMMLFPCAIYIKLFGLQGKNIGILIICVIAILCGYTGAVVSQFPPSK